MSGRQTTIIISSCTLNNYENYLEQYFQIALVSLFELRILKIVCQKDGTTTTLGISSGVASYLEMGNFTPVTSDFVTGQLK